MTMTDYKEASEYTVELGDQLFTSSQWDTISTYAKGYHLTQERQFSRMQDAVTEFRTGMGQHVGQRPQAIPQEHVATHIELVREEFEDELVPALQTGDLVETVDACLDLIYVVMGILVDAGVNASPGFEEVHSSNMSKFGADGKAIIAGSDDPDGVFQGRVKKGPNYFRPNLEGLIASGTANLGDA